MNSAYITKILDDIQPDLEQVEDQAPKKAVSILLNLVEVSVADNDELKEEIQTLKDEINRLKGEQGKPDIKSRKKKVGDISSEKERKQAEESDEDKANQEGFKLDANSLEKLKEQRLPAELLDQLKSINSNKYTNEQEFINAIESVIGKALTNQYRSLLIQYARYKKRNRKAKLPNIVIDRHEICTVNTKKLPSDAKFKGYESKVVQDVIIKTDNVEFQREIYHSASLNKTYLGEIPKGYEGDFGPHINANIISMKYVNGMSIPKITTFYNDIGTFISSSYISNSLIKSAHMDVFHNEKSEMHKTAIEASAYIQIDDTGSRVNGENHYTQIICNEFYTAFFTSKRKNRLTILEILRNFESTHFLLNDKTVVLLEQLGISKSDILLLSEYKQDKSLNEAEMLEILKSIYVPDEKPRIQAKIMEACAITCYRQETGIPVVKVLVSDDAPQFKLLTDELALCWIHEGRHYKKLNPIVPIHQKELNDFLQNFWVYYGDLTAYKKNPNTKQAELLSQKFDRLFSTETNYDELDKRIKKSKNKKNELLVVLKHPEVPLHNNMSENGARVEKRRQDVSLQTKTDEGTKAKDTMMSIVETCRKLGISAYKFIYDRISGQNKMPTLSEMIQAKVADKAPI